MCLCKHLRFLWLTQGWANGTAMGLVLLGRRSFYFPGPDQLQEPNTPYMPFLKLAWRWCHGSWPSVALRFVVGILIPTCFCYPAVCLALALKSLLGHDLTGLQALWCHAGCFMCQVGAKHRLVFLLNCGFQSP